jgi:hypothetical protein
VALIPTTSKLRSALALGLVLWCAGAGCLAHGMAMRGVAPAPESKSTKPKSSQSEMTMNGHACCKARHRSLQSESAAKSNPDTGSGTIALPEDSSSDAAASCCPLTSGSFVTVSRSQTDDNNSSGSTGTSLPEQSFTARFPSNSATPLRLPGREQTYLTCCAFLI